MFKCSGGNLRGCSTLPRNSRLLLRALLASLEALIPLRAPLNLLRRGLHFLAEQLRGALALPPVLPSLGVVALPIVVAPSPSLGALPAALSPAFAIFFVVPPTTSIVMPPLLIAPTASRPAAVVTPTAAVPICIAVVV